MAAVLWDLAGFLRGETGWVAETMSSYNRDLIEQARQVNKLLSLYVLALQEEMAFTTDDHDRLASALRGVANAVEQEGRAQQFVGPPANSSRGTTPTPTGAAVSAANP